LRQSGSRSSHKYISRSRLPEVMDAAWIDARG
jgi:hypothetical protein